MLRILLAEDDQVMREYLTRALQRSGYAVTAVDRGTAAIPLLETERFDLLPGWTTPRREDLAEVTRIMAGEADAGAAPPVERGSMAA